MKLLTEAHKALINESKIASKYSITLKEWNLFKKLAKELTPEGCELETNKRGSWCNATIRVDESMLDMSATICSSLAHNRWVPRYTKEKDQLEQEFKDLFNAFNVTYSESDLMTDYYGHYRINGNAMVFCKRELENSIMSLVNELRKISTTGFMHNDAIRINKELNLGINLEALN